MSATDPIHQEIKYNDGDYLRSSYESMTAEEIEKALKSAAFPYQWGVYTTAYARKQLQDAIDLCGEKLIYCDTDSVKTLGDVPIQKLNGPLKARAERMGAYADDMNGRRHYIGVFEPDGHYKQFITQGAKRYAYMDFDDEIHVTVAGVSTAINEKTGKSFAAEELETLDRFRPGMVWKAAGGTMAVYNDQDDFNYTDPETGKRVHIGKNVSIIPTTYEMTHSRDYRLLLEQIQLYSEFRKDRE